MANGLTNAVRHEFVMIANDRQIYVAVRKHSRSFLWCFECYADINAAWTTDGRIVCLLENGEKRTIVTERDLDQLHRHQ